MASLWHAVLDHAALVSAYPADLLRLRLVSRACQRSDVPADVLVVKSNAERALGLLSAARLSALRAVELSRGAWNARRALANSLDELRHYQPALAEFMRSLSLRLDPLSLCMTGDALRRIGLLGDADAFYAAALRLDPRDRAAWMSRVLLSAMRDLAQAKLTLTAAISRLQEDGAEFQMMYSVLNGESAKQPVSSALTIEDRIDYHVTMAWLCLRCNQLAEAAQQAQHARLLGWYYPGVASVYAYVAIARGDASRGADILSKRVDQRRAGWRDLVVLRALALTRVTRVRAVIGGAEYVRLRRRMAAARRWVRGRGRRAGLAELLGRV